MEKGAYVLGTHRAELHRLGLQHQVWASEAQKAWDDAGFSHGQTLLDIGCGPGFCSTELAYRVGQSGKVIAVDKSNTYIEYLRETALMQGLNVDLRNIDLHELELAENSIDGVYCRWVFGWIENVEPIIANISSSMKKGAHFITHEYYAWQYLTVEPQIPEIIKCIKACFKSFDSAPGNVNVGRQLPSIFPKYGLHVKSVRPILKLCKPADFTWQWPETFFDVYWPTLVDKDLITQTELDEGLGAFKNLKNIEGATCFCPPVIEVIAEKV